LGIAGALFEVLSIQQSQQFQLLCLFAAADAIIPYIFDEFLDFRVVGIDVGALEDTGEEPGLPVLRLLNGISSGAHGNESGKILVIRSQSPGEP